MEAIINSLKKMKKDELIDLITDAMEISEINEKIFEALLIKNPTEQFNALGEMIDELVYFDRYLEINYDSALNAIETYYRITDSLEGKIALQLKFVNCLFHIASMNGDIIDGTFEIEDTLLDELEDALKSARKCDMLNVIEQTVATFLAFSREYSFPNWDRLFELYTSYYEYKPELIDNILKEMKEKIAQTKISLAKGESFADIFDDYDEDEDLDSIFDDDDEDWDDEDGDFDDDNASPTIPKATPKEKITKLF